MLPFSQACLLRQKDVHILSSLLHATTIERDSKQARQPAITTTTTLRRNTCLFQALMSPRPTRQPHPHTLPFAYAPRLRPNPRFVVALVQHSGKHISVHVYVCLASRPAVRRQMRWRCSICAFAVSAFVKCMYVRCTT